MTRVIPVNLAAERAASRARTSADQQAARLRSRALVVLGAGWAQGVDELRASAASAYPNAGAEEIGAMVREACRLQIEGRGTPVDLATVQVLPPEPEIGARVRRTAPRPLVDLIEEGPAAPADDETHPPADPLPASEDEQQEASMPEDRSTARRLTPAQRDQVHAYILGELRKDGAAASRAVFNGLAAATGIEMSRPSFAPYWQRALAAFERGDDVLTTQATSVVPPPAADRNRGADDGARHRLGRGVRGRPLPDRAAPRHAGRGRVRAGARRRAAGARAGGGGPWLR